MRLLCVEGVGVGHGVEEDGEWRVEESWSLDYLSVTIDT